MLGFCLVRFLRRGERSATLFDPKPCTSAASAESGLSSRRTPYVLEQVRSGRWRDGLIPGAETGLARDLRVFWAERRTSPILHDWHGDAQTHCPPVYWDLAIGSSSCGLACRGCFLLGTFRERRDPFQPVIYENVAFLWEAARRWLIHSDRRSYHTLGVGTDRCDSLLFEGPLGHVRHLSKLFADPQRNPRGCKLLLLTKSSNSRYLQDLPPTNVIVSLSLNPQAIADLWEGRWPDTGARIPPAIEHRLAAALHAQNMGFEVRWRLDPILTPEGWEEHYREFLARAVAAGHRPARITLGSFRETTPQLEQWRSYWGVPPMDWRPKPLVRDGTHWRPPASSRVEMYRRVASICSQYLPSVPLSLCKETQTVRRLSGLCSQLCNCLGPTRVP